MPYKSQAQAGYMHIHHPGIAAKWDSEHHEAKKKGKIKKIPKHVSKRDWTKHFGASVIDEGQALVDPRVQAAIRRRKKKKGRVKKMMAPTSTDPYFNHQAAQKAFDLVMKMDDDTAEMFTYIVASDLFEETVEKNLGTIQRALNQVFAQRTEQVKKALVKATQHTDDPQAVEYAKALHELEEISKAPHTPQYYGYTWKETDFRRDPSTGRFSVKVNHTMNKPLPKKQAERIIGAHGPKELNDGQRARYQDEYRQVSSFLSAVNAIGAGNMDVVYHLKDKAENRFSTVQNSGQPPKSLLEDPDVELVAMEAKPTTLSVGGAAYGLSSALGGGGLTGEQLTRANLAAEKFPVATGQWATAGREQEQTSRMFNRLESTGGFMNQAGAPGGKVQMAGKFAEIVGQYGPEAERVIGPSTRKTAYRYRGTEKTPEKILTGTYGREIQDAKRYGVEEEEADQRLLGFGTKREQMRGDFVTGEVRRARGAKERRANLVTPAIGQMGRSESELAARPPNWAERGAGAALVANYLRQKLPDKHLYRLHLEAGNTPPSEGVIVNDEGQLAVQAVGYGDDHYVPFNLKNLKSLKGGEYIRNRSVGGPTSEDVYTGLMGGARRLTVVSRSGTFTVEFEEDFRGGRRHNDKARRMTRRYEQLLDAVQSGKVDRQTIPKRWRDEIKREVEEEYRGAPRPQIRDEVQARLTEFKENPEIEGRDLERAEAMIARMESRASMGEIPERDAAQYRREIMNELHNMKEVRFRLNGIGYEAALKSLQEQFPYYIKSVKTNPTRDEDLLEFELDEGYVEPGRNRPSKARAGLHGTKENPSEKFSASQADYQRGRTGKGQFQRAVQAPVPGAPTPETGGEGTGETTPDARRKKAQELQDSYAEQAKIRSAKKAASELRDAVLRGKPEWPNNEAPDFMVMDEDTFKEWVTRPENATEFHRVMEQNKDQWRKPGEMPGFAASWVAYEAARGQTKQVKYQPANAGHFPAVPYSFAHLNEDAYHAGARPSVITAEKAKIDREDVNFTTKKLVSQLTPKEMEDEIEMTAYLRDQAKGAGITDTLAVHAQNTPDAPSPERMKVVLSSDKAVNKHLENIHRMRYLTEMEKVAKNPPAAPPTSNQGGGNQGGSSPGGGGGQPATPSSPRPTTEPGGQTTTTETTINARVERIKGAREAVLKLDKDSQDASLTQAQRNKARKDMQAIAGFGEILRKNKAMTDPQLIDALMDEKLNDNQKQYVAGLF
jgi:hypothetical protein